MIVNPIFQTNKEKNDFVIKLKKKYNVINYQEEKLNDGRIRLNIIIKIKGTRSK